MQRRTPFPSSNWSPSFPRQPRMRPAGKGRRDERAERISPKPLCTHKERGTERRKVDVASFDQKGGIVFSCDPLVGCRLVPFRHAICSALGGTLPPTYLPPPSRGSLLPLTAPSSPQLHYLSSSLPAAPSFLSAHSSFLSLLFLLSYLTDFSCQLSWPVVGAHKSWTQSKDEHSDSWSLNFISSPQTLGRCFLLLLDEWITVLVWLFFHRAIHSEQGFV